MLMYANGSVNEQSYTIVHKALTKIKTLHNGSKNVHIGRFLPRYLPRYLPKEENTFFFKKKERKTGNYLGSYLGSYLSFFPFS